MHTLLPQSDYDGLHHIASRLLKAHSNLNSQYGRIPAAFEVPIGYSCESFNGLLATLDEDSASS